MVNKPDSVPPSHGPKGPEQTPASKKTEEAGMKEFHFKTPPSYLGMKFTAEQWDKFMNIMLKNVCDYINTSMQKMTAKLKKDWKRGQGEDVDD